MMMQKVMIYATAILMLLGCESNNANEVSEEPSPGVTKIKQSNGIVGEWEQQFTCFDKNGNYELETEEKQPSGAHLGFNWFLFRSDGTCLRDKDIKFKGTYEILEQNGKKNLVILGGDNIRYTIHELTDKELTLGASGAFIIFRRI